MDEGEISKTSVTTERAQRIMNIFDQINLRVEVTQV